MIVEANTELENFRKKYDNLQSTQKQAVDITVELDKKYQQKIEILCSENEKLSSFI